MNKNKKILIAIIIIISIITLSNKIFAISTSEDSKEEVIEDGSNYKMYSIEDIIFNRVPILDVNVFSDTAGGKQINPKSTIAILRNAVAIWYVTFRNMAICIFVIIIIFAGVKIAISTVSGQKAKYKEMLFELLKSLAILLIMNYIMVIVLNLNDIFVKMIESAMGNVTQNGSIYDTIRTRAYDFRAEIGRPAAFMYVVLVILLVKYVFLYLKRLFTVLILIIVAPFVAVKNAIAATKGKRQSTFQTWIYDFSINVFIQSIHAIIYVTLISVALNLANTNIIGFIIALVIMNFSTKAGENFTRIFKFAGANGSKIAPDIHKSINIKDIAKLKTMEAYVKAPFKVEFGIAKKIGQGGINVGKSVIGVRRQNAIKDNMNKKLDAIDTATENILTRHVIKNGKGQEYIVGIMQLRRNARKRGIVGDNSKRILRKYRKLNKGTFTSSFRYVKDVTTGLGEVALAIPAAIAFSSAKNKSYIGTQLFNKGLGKLTKYSFGGIKEGQEETKGKYKKINSTIKYVNDINEETGKIEEKIEGIDSGERGILKQKLEEINGLNINAYSLQQTIQQYVEANDITTLDDTTVGSMVEEVLSQVGIEEKYGGAVKAQISQIAQKAINTNQAKEVAMLAKTISDTATTEIVKESKFSQENVAIEIAKGINSINDTNASCQEETSKKIIDTNQYISQNL